jgi:hypothetical protein
VLSGGASCGELFEHSGRLSDLDEVSVGVAHVAANLGAAINRRGQKGRALGRPFLVDLFDVGYTEVEECADTVEVGGDLEVDVWFVVGWAAARVDDDPTRSDYCSMSNM